MISVIFIPKFLIFKLRLVYHKFYVFYANGLYFPIFFVKIYLNEFYWIWEISQGIISLRRL